MRSTRTWLGTSSVLVALAFASCTGVDESSRSEAVASAPSGDDCTRTQGFWKNHPDLWPVSSLTLGTVSYTEAQLIAILKTPVGGNGLIQLAHQLIAAKLNIAAGACDDSIADSIAAADAMIGGLVVPPIGSGSLATSQTSAVNGALDTFNNSETACGCEGGGPECGNGIVEAGEECDDGNTTDGDGCSANCVCEPTPVCGNGIVEAGEQCDDGNTTNGDGCSASCVCEPAPVCGNGILEGDEQCDDGNTTNGDGCSATCVCEPS